MCVCIIALVTRHANRIFSAPYCHLWPAPLYKIFALDLTNGTIFGEKKLLNTKCVF